MKIIDKEVDTTTDETSKEGSAELQHLPLLAPSFRRKGYFTRATFPSQIQIATACANALNYIQVSTSPKLQSFELFQSTFGNSKMRRLKDESISSPESSDYQTYFIFECSVERPHKTSQI